MKIKGKEHMDIIVRAIKLDDYPELEKWWKTYDHHNIYKNKSLLPDNGLGGYVVVKEGRLIASCFLYLTNSAIGYIDYLVADPTYREEDRLELLLDLAARVTAVAIDKGCESIWAMSKNKGVIEYAAKPGGLFGLESGDYKICRTYDKHNN
tara:strand:+ start:62 stop:514 length:453 start_codon:yes stop_codon:yes gene_type:complete